MLIDVNCGAAMCWQQCMHFLLCQASARFAASLLVLGSPSNSQLGAGKKAMPASGPAICRKKGSTWSQGGPVRIKHACGRIGSVGACPPTVNSFKAGLFLLCGTCLPFLFYSVCSGVKEELGPVCGCAWSTRNVPCKDRVRAPWCKTGSR